MDGREVIRLEGIDKTFRSDLGAKPVRAVRELTLSVTAGEVFGFLGPNGAGKSTTIKILVNLIRPDRGRACVLDIDVAQCAVRRKIGYLPENPYFYDHLTADELLWFGGRTAGLSKTQIRERSDLLLDKLSLTSARRRPLRTYSKGMVQRAGLALALIHDPQVVILDEPMSGLDPLGRKLVGDLIMEMKAEGKTVFFSSHILTDVERFCDRAGIIVGGQLRLVAPLPELLANGRSLEAVFLEQVALAGGGVMQ